MSIAAQSAPPVRESRRFWLRDVTARPHAALERVVEAGQAFSAVRAYRHYLLLSWRARASIEAWLDDVGAERVWPRWPQRRISDVLARDIIDLGGADPRRADGAGGDYAKTFDAPTGHGSVLGVLYVLEGSALGARLLAAEAAKLGLHRGFGAGHIHRQVGDGRGWRDFVDVLEEADLDADDEDRLVQSANQTFEAFAASYRDLLADRGQA